MQSRALEASTPDLPNPVLLNARWPAPLTSSPSPNCIFSTAPIMATHIPRQPYTPEELAKLYPKELELQLVQVVSKAFFCRPCRYTRSIPCTTQFGIQADQLKLLRHGALHHAHAGIPTLVLTRTQRRASTSDTPISECECGYPLYPHHVNNKLRPAFGLVSSIDMPGWILY